MADFRYRIFFLKGVVFLEKYFNEISICIGLIGGVLVNYLGGMDVILHTILFLVIVDYITGLAKAWKQKQISSEIGFLGLLKKAMIFIVIAISVEIEKLTNHNIPLREVVIMFYISNEGISLLENLSEFVPLPDKIADYFIQIRNKREKE